LPNPNDPGNGDDPKRKHEKPEEDLIHVEFNYFAPAHLKPKILNELMTAFQELAFCRMQSEYLRNRKGVHFSEYLMHMIAVLYQIVTALAQKEGLKPRIVRPGDNP